MFWSPSVDPGEPSKACETVMPPNRLRLPAHAIPVTTRITTAASAVSTWAAISSGRLAPLLGIRWRGVDERGRMSRPLKRCAGLVMITRHHPTLNVVRWSGTSCSG